MANNDSIVSFNDIYDRWKKEIALDRVIKKEYGKLSLAEFEPALIELNTRLDRIHSHANKIPSSTLIEVNSQFNNIFGWCKRIAGLREEEFTQSRSNYIHEFRRFFEAFDALWVNLLPVIHEANLELNSGLAQQIAGSQAKINDLIKEQENELTNLRNKFKDIYSGAAFEKESRRFEHTADGFRQKANIWGALVGLSALSLLLWLVIIAFNFCFDSSCYALSNLGKYNNTCYQCAEDVLHFEMVKSLLFRVLIVAVLSVLLTLCVKNYNSNMHNFTINKQKSNSLDAALYLLGKASPQANDFVINQAASAIFSHQPTGYSSKDPENADNAFLEKLSELLKRN